MKPRTFHLTAASGLTLAALLAALTTPPIEAASAVTPATATVRPAWSVKQQTVSAALARGYTPTDLRCALRLIYRESRFNPAARNPRSTASGLWQHLRSPSGVMLADLSVPAQNARGLRYLAHRYGSAADPHGACTALAYHRKVGHY